MQLGAFYPYSRNHNQKGTRVSHSFLTEPLQHTCTDQPEHHTGWPASKKVHSKQNRQEKNMSGSLSDKNCLCLYTRSAVSLPLPWEVYAHRRAALGFGALEGSMPSVCFDRVKLLHIFPCVLFLFKCITLARLK